jgi:hypothetical protein
LTDLIELDVLSLLAPADAVPNYAQWNLGGRELRVVKIPAVLLVVSGKLRRRSAVNAPNPPGQVALVGKACSGRDFSQAAAAIAHKLKSAP